MPDAIAAENWLEGGGIDSPRGVSATGLACGLKRDGALDVAVVKADERFSAAGVFTTNAVKAAPVLYDMEVLARSPGRIGGVVVNSGNANAVTGPQGMQAAAATARHAAQVLCRDEDVDFLVMSTGVIGVQLPLEKVLDGLSRAADSDWGGGSTAARAIMTTDSVPKHCALRLNLAAGPVTIGGMAKGAGMIHPDMATMLALLTTDAALDAAALQPILARAVSQSFNCISVDGDTSTNDTALLLASGASGVTPGGPDLQSFEAGLLAVCQRLAQAIVRDAEGATKFITVHVSGARDPREAHRVANTIATSPLVKTAFYGGDANWGRILAAAGRSGADLEPARLALWLEDLQLLSGGTPTDYAEADAAAIMARDDIAVRLDLGVGEAESTVWTCDLSHDYVSINGQYRT